MAKKTEPKSPAPARGVVQPVRSPKTTAGPCPRVKHHTNTRVYRTDGQTRYCVCDDCPDQTKWKVIAEYADEDRQWLAELADALAAAEPVETEDAKVIVLQLSLRDEIVTRLRTIARR